MGLILWVFIAAILGIVLWGICYQIDNEKEDWYDQQYGKDRGENED